MDDERPHAIEPARQVGAPFPETMKQVRVGLYDLAGAHVGDWAVEGAAELSLGAPREPGLYFVHVSGRGDSGAGYQLNLKLAVLP